MSSPPDTVANAPTTRWKDNALLYPPAEEICKALQDPGKIVNVKEKGVTVHKHKFKDADKLAQKVFNSIKEIYKPESFGKHKSRGKIPLLKEIILNRKHRDASELDVFFHQFAKDGRVYTLSENPIHCGLDLAIDHFQGRCEAKVDKQAAARTYNEGLRLGCILLDPKYRGSVSGIMTKKKDRKNSDQSGDVVTHFYEMILEEAFMNPDYECPKPPDEHWSGFPELERDLWDPNDPDIFDKERDADWLRKTWDDYMRKKYKAALD